MRERLEIFVAVTGVAIGFALGLCALAIMLLQIALVNGLVTL